MRLSKLVIIVTGLVIGVFALSGCTNNAPLPVPPPSSPVVTMTPTPNVTATPSPASNLKINASALDSLVAPAGVDPTVFKIMIDSARGFSLASVTNTAALSGKWTTSELAAGFAPFASDILTQQIAALDPTNLDNSYTIMSLAAVLTPTGDLKAKDSCTPAGKWTECLTQDITYSDATAVLDAPVSAVKFSFVLSTARGVLVAGETRQSAVKYSMNVWVDVSTHDVVAVDNDFSFAPVG